MTGTNRVSDSGSFIFLNYIKVGLKGSIVTYSICS